MTIIVAFILEAFVFRMNYSRKSQDSEGLYGCHALGTGCPSHICYTLLSHWPSPHACLCQLHQLSFCVGLSMSRLCPLLKL